MVKGLELFRHHFRDFADQYALIGGAACDLSMEEAGLDFRATKDLDMVLCVEALDAAFVKAFWEFIREGGYQQQQKATGQKQFYRFQKPSNEDFPFMLELFSRVPDAIDLAGTSHLTPIPTEEEISSLSAILMNEDYYRFLHTGKKNSDGISFVGPDRLIPLKARAWLDLMERSTQGEAIDRKSIRKHMNDVLRLSQILDPEFSGELPEKIKGDLRQFIDRLGSEEINLKSLGLTATSSEEIVALLKRAYSLE